jgi:hypothetical protein
MSTNYHFVPPTSPVRTEIMLSDKIYTLPCADRLKVREGKMEKRHVLVVMIIVVVMVVVVIVVVVVVVVVVVAMIV